MKFFQSKKFKIGAYASAVTAVVLLLVVALNVIAVQLTEKKDAFIDLTEQKAFALSDQVREVFRGIEQPIRVTVLSDRETYTTLNPYCAQVAYILDQAVKENEQIQVEYIDPLKNPEIKASFPDQYCTQGDMIMQNLDTMRTFEIPFIDLFYLSGDGRSISGSKAEAVIASRMQSMGSGEVYSVVFTSGHSENEAEGLRSLLELNNYTVSDAATITGDIGEETLCVVICAPKTDFSTDEIVKLEQYLVNDGKYGHSILYFASIEQGPLPNLESFLANYGIQVSSEVVGETNSNYVYGDSNYNALTGFLEEVYSGRARSMNLGTISPYTRAVNLLYESSSSITTQAILNFSPDAIAVDMVSGTKTRDGKGGDLYAMAVSTQKEYVTGEGERSSRLAVFGSAQFADDNLLSTESLGNAEMLISVMGQLAPNETSIEVAPKSILGGYMSITQKAATILGIVFVGVLPVLVLLAGIYVYSKRRNK